MDMYNYTTSSLSLSLSLSLSSINDLIKKLS